MQKVKQRFFLGGRQLGCAKYEKNIQVDELINGLPIQKKFIVQYMPTQLLFKNSDLCHMT